MITATVPCLACHRYRHVATLGAVFEGVGEQVANHAFQEWRVHEGLRLRQRRLDEKTMLREPDLLCQHPAHERHQVGLVAFQLEPRTHANTGEIVQLPNRAGQPLGGRDDAGNAQRERGGIRSIELAQLQLGQLRVA